MPHNFLQKYFPPPDFLRMPIAGLDISDDSVHIAELGFGGGARVVKNLHKKLFPMGLIEDGHVKDVEKIKQFFAQLRKDYNLKYVNVSLPEQHGYVVVVRIPKMLPDEIYGSLELQLEDHVPISINEAVFGYDIIRGAGAGDDLPFIELNVTVYPRNIVEEYISLFTETGIMPLRFEIEAHAVSRAVVPKGDKGTYMILDFGKTRTGITIVNKEAVSFTSTIALGGDTITRAIARNFDIGFDEAEALKKEKGCLVDGGDQKMLLALMPTVSALKDEINKHFQYWNTRLDDFGKKRPSINSIILCGGLANLAGFPEYLGSNLKAEVRLANVFVNVNSFDEYIPEIHFKESLQYATSIGLALSSDR
jgi:type IV pilus assembly protein PilM